MADRGHCDREAEFLRLLRDAWQLPARPVRQVALAGTPAS